MSFIRLCGVFGLQILLPYVIGCLFGIGYGSVVAAGGWEALRVPAVPDSTVPGAGGTGGGSCGGGTGGSGGGDGGGDTNGGGGAHDGGGSALRETFKRDLSFAAQVCAWDSRADEEAHADGEEDDEDDDFDSSVPGSDNDELSEVEDHRGGGVAGRKAVVAPPASSGAAAVGATVRGQPTDRMTRAKARNLGFQESFDGSGGSSIGAPGFGRVGDANTAGPEPTPDSLPVRVPGSSATENGGGVGDGSSSGGQGDAARTADGGDGVGSGIGGGGGGGEHLRRVSLVHHASSYDSPGADDDDDEEEDGSGWGQQVVVKPVKVARWDKSGLRSKALLSLNQLRACIIERAESTPQKATYRRAAKLVRFFDCGFWCIWRQQLF